jgi:hypothetical protein
MAPCAILSGRHKPVIMPGGVRAWISRCVEQRAVQMLEPGVALIRAAVRGRADDAEQTDRPAVGARRGCAPMTVAGRAWPPKGAVAGRIAP